MTFRPLLPTGLIQMLPNRIAPVLFCIAAVVLVSGSQTNAQEECEKYHRWDRTVFVTQPITENRLVEETSFETVKETKYLTVRQSEDRERTVIEEKPVTRTSERVQRTVVPKKITETKYRTVRRVENSFEDVTEMREEKYTVRKPVTETTIREEKVTVRKPITETQVKKEQITTLKPKSFRQTAQVPGTLLVPGVTGSRCPAVGMPITPRADPFGGAPVCIGYKNHNSAKLPFPWSCLKKSNRSHWFPKPSPLRSQSK